MTTTYGVKNVPECEHESWVRFALDELFCLIVVIILVSLIEGWEVIAWFGRQFRKISQIAKK